MGTAKPSFTSVSLESIGDVEDRAEKEASIKETAGMVFGGAYSTVFDLHLLM